MDNLDGHSEHAYQPEGQQPNGLPLPVPWFFPEQHWLQLDQVLQLLNKQIWVSLQREMAIQDANLLNLLTIDALIQIQIWVASLRIELQRMQEDPITLLHDWDQLMRLALMAYEVLINMQQETYSHVSSNELEDDASSLVARTATEATRPDLICKVCNSGGSCMVLLPCLHLCACKPCGVRLTACPICGAVKHDARDMSCPPCCEG